MDRQLKARLIGAAVLVLLVVLLVPELLTGRKSPGPEASGPKGDRGTRSVTIDLGGRAGSAAQPPAERLATPPAAQHADAGETRSSSLPAATAREAPQAEPVEAPTVRPEPVPGPDSAPVSTPTRNASTEQAEPEGEATAPPVRGDWAVQVGAFSATASARKLVQELEAAGYRAYVSPVKRSGKELHRVRVGPEPDRAAAVRLAGKLEARGLPASVVASD